jgi:hypothetical protein
MGFVLGYQYRSSRSPVPVVIPTINHVTTSNGVAQYVYSGFNQLSFDP